LTVDNYIVPESKEIAQPLLKGGRKSFKVPFFKGFRGSKSNEEV
jgi:hypothetical protein